MMKLSTPINRSWLLWVIFAMLMLQLIGHWVSLRFWLNDASYRSLAPEYYNVSVITPEEYRRLSDPANSDVTLSDGTHMVDRAPAWFTKVLPNYKATRDGRFYVLVTTKGTAHILPYVEGRFLLLGFLTLCGFAVSFWNLLRVCREQMPVGSEPS